MRALLVVALLAACETKSEKYCASHPDDQANCGGTSPTPDAPVSGPACTGDGDCSAPTPRCLDMTTCVGCLDASDCTASAPTCDATTHACRACMANSDCPSQLCLAGGTCAVASDVAYVGGNNAANQACTLAAPCASLRDAIALPTYPKYIRVLSDITESDTVTFDGTHTVEIFGAGNKVQLAFGGVGIEVRDSVALTAHEVMLSHVNSNPSASDDCILVNSATASLTFQAGRITGCGGDGINSNDGTVTLEGSTLRDDQIGVEAFGDTAMTIRRSLFRDTTGTAIYGNSSKTVVVDASIVFNCGTGFSAGDPGVDIIGALNMTNSIVAQSGDPNNPTLGAVRLNNSATAVSRLDFVTIANNSTQGLSCTLGTQTLLTNVIMTGNNQSITCKASYGLVKDGADGAMHTRTGDPMFLNTDDPTSPMFYRIGSQSAAIGIGMADAVTTDIDGQPRTSTPDVGADEYVP